MIIDTDGGIDDAVAIWWALREPGVDVVGISTVWGNVDLDVATANVHRVLEAAGRAGIPVAAGVVKAIGPAPLLRRADFVHGTYGLGNTQRPEASAKTTISLEELWSGPGADADVLVTLGPLSTVATAISAQYIPTTQLRLVIMGGTIASPGNALPVAEANIAHDPTAAAAVLAAPWAVPPLLVGLDVTHKATFGPTEIAILERRGNHAATWLADPLAFYRAGGSAFVAEGEMPCHDLLAVMAAALPGLVGGPVVPLAVQCEPGPAWGMTVADRRSLTRALNESNMSNQPTPPGYAPAQVGLDVDVEHFRAQVRTLFGASTVA